MFDALCKHVSVGTGELGLRKMGENFSCMPMERILHYNPRIAVYAIANAVALDAPFINHMHRSKAKLFIYIAIPQ